MYVCMYVCDISVYIYLVQIALQCYLAIKEEVVDFGAQLHVVADEDDVLDVEPEHRHDVGLQNLHACDGDCNGFG